jgi:hypothetical protein
MVARLPSADCLVRVAFAMKALRMAMGEAHYLYTLAHVMDQCPIAA